MITGLTHRQLSDYQGMQARIRATEAVPVLLRYARSTDIVQHDAEVRARRNDLQARRELAEATSDPF